MEELRRAVDAVLAEDPHALADVELGERLRGLEREMARLAAAQLATLAVFESRQAYAAEGAANAAAWLRHQCRLAPGDAFSRVRIAGLVQPASGLPVPAAPPPALQGNPPPCGRHP